MSKRFIFTVIPFALVIMLLALSGCASSSPTAQSTQSSQQPPVNTSLDACTLLTKADAEQIMGKPVDDPTHPVQGNETFTVDSCEYKVQGGTALDNVTLIVTVSSNGDLATAQTAFNTGEQQAQAAYGASPVDVPGVGDSAYWVGGSGNNLSVLKGNVNINLGASTQKGESPSQAIIDLAKVVLGRLP